MTGFDQSQSPRLGQRLPYEATSVRMFSGEEIPEAAFTGQMIYRTDTQGLQVFTGEAWEDVVGGTAGILTYVGPTMPVGANAGDLWYDSDDGHRLYWHNGTTFIDISDDRITAAALAATAAQADADQAIADAADAQATADGKVRTFFQTSAPTGMAAGDVGDLWFDTDDQNKMYRWSGSAWVLSDDQRIAATVTAASNAQTTANSKITTYYQTSPPTSTAAGDLWVDTDDGNKLYRASAVGVTTVVTSGSGWYNVQDAAIVTNAGAIATANSNISGLQTQVDGKVTTYFQSGAPWADGLTTHPNDDGDLWFKTTDKTTWRWNATTHLWVQIQDSSITTALTNAATAQGTADGKISHYITNVPPWPDGAPSPGDPNDTGDIWTNPDEGNKRYYWNTLDAAWEPIPSGAGDIQDEAIGDNHIGEGAVSGTHLKADAIDGKTVTGAHIRTHADSTVGVHIDEAGIRAYGLTPGGSPFLDVNPALGLVIVAGKGTFEELTVNGDTDFNGVTELQSGAKLRLVGGATPPARAPVVGSTYDQVQFNNDGDWANRRGWAYDPVNNKYYTINERTRKVERWDGVTRSRDVQSVAGSQTAGLISMSGTKIMHSSIAYGGGKVWTGHKADGAQGDGWIGRWDPSTLAREDMDLFPTASGYQQTGGRSFAVGYDATVAATGPLLIATARDSDDVVLVKRCTYTGSTITFNSTVTTTAVIAANCISILYHSTGFDFGGAPARYVLSTTTGNTHFVIDGSTLARRTSDDWSGGPGAPTKLGMIYNGFNFSMADKSGVQYDYTLMDASVAVGSATTNKWIYASYYRSGGAYETSVSPAYNYPLFPKRSKMTITGPLLKASPGANDPDRWLWYAGTGTTEPANSAIWRQNPVTGISATTQTETNTLISSATAHPVTPAPGNFPASTPSNIETTDNGFTVNHQADGTPGTGTFGQRTLNPVGAMTMFAGASAPAGWYLCDGATKNTTTDAALFAVIGYTYGGSGTSFTLPDMRDNFPVGTSGTKALGTTGGSATKSVTINNITRRESATAFGAAASFATPSATGTLVAGTAMDVMNPWRSVNYIIKF